MSGYESLSSLFQYSIELVSENGEIDINELLGQSLSLEVNQQGVAARWFNGDIISISLKGKEGNSSRYHVYKFEIRPKLWYLTLNQDYRIFQEKDVPTIVSEILNDFNVKFDNRLKNRYRQWDYCVQYAESAFDFISRLMEHEGIYYFFEYQNDKHTLVLVDDIYSHQSLVDYPILPFRGLVASAIVNEACIDQWNANNSITVKQVSMTDYDFKKPYATLLEVKNNASSYSPEHTERYEWPGGFIDKEHADFYTQIRQQEKAAQQEKLTGSATTASIAPGFKFTLIKAARQLDNREYLIVQANYTLWDNSYASGEDAERGQRTDFVVIPGKNFWRSPRITPWPKTNGPQTARIVCPPGETIWTDKYGRVKVKFHWDRYHGDDGNSSCWIRVASAWASQGFGMVQIPRLYDEVIVDFINGDPDRPIIIGRVYNEANMPPWDLPENATQMGIYSRSKRGHKETANALRFEDKAGEEQVWIHAEKDMQTDVENNEALSVTANRQKTIGGNESSEILQNQTEDIAANKTVSVGQNYSETVGDTYQLSAGSDINMNSGATTYIDAASTLVLTCGSSKIIMDSGGSITLQGIDINIQGAAGVEIKGKAVDIN